MSNLPFAFREQGVAVLVGQGSKRAAVRPVGVDVHCWEPNTLSPPPVTRERVPAS
jgi:hypothetical protein